MELNQLFEGSNNYKTLQADAARLSGKWAKSGLLEGISNEIERNNMAMILENQAKQIVSENVTGTNAMGTSTGGAEQWAGVALPLVRKVFAQIAAKDFVSVQPMNLPSGLVFYLDFKYGTNTVGRANGDSLYGNASRANDKMGIDEEVNGGLYGAGEFGYSLNSASYAGVLTTSGSAISSSIGYNDGLATGDFFTLAVATSSLTGFDAKGVRAFRLYSASVDVTTNPEFTFVSSSAAGEFVKFVVAKAGDVANSVTAVTTGSFTAGVKYQMQPTDTSRGDFEDNGTGPAGANGTIKIPEINVSLASEAIVAKTRKLKAQWTPEFAQDLNSYHSIDAEAELTSLLSEYISMEIDLELMDMLIQDAATTERWSAVNNKTWTGTAWSTTASAFYNTQGQWFGTLGTKVQKVSNKIHQKTLRGGANFLVCSPSVATILESIPGYAADTNGDKMDFAMGVQKVGNLNSRFRVYKNPYMTENVILMGYRGSQFLETGAVYAPYIPLIMTPLVYDPTTFTPRKGIMTRYAKKMIRPEFYGKIFVSDIATV